jgi:hypothetical protein
MAVRTYELAFGDFGQDAFSIALAPEIPEVVHLLVAGKMIPGVIDLPAGLAPELKPVAAASVERAFGLVFSASAAALHGHRLYGKTRRYPAVFALS